MAIERYGPQFHKKIQGVKFDEDKPRPELIPAEVIDALGVVLAYGAKKYEDRNWEKGMAWGRVFGALQRHLWAWWSGSGKDDDTGFSHLWHAACCIAFLVAYEKRGIGTDDRVKEEEGESGEETFEPRQHFVTNAP
jgi:hypothetical protein